MSKRSSSAAADRLSRWCWHVGLQVTLWSAGGMLARMFEPAGPVAAEARPDRLVTGGVVAGALLLLFSGLRLGRRRCGKKMVFSTLLHAMVLAATAISVEWAARSAVPAWPARDLHGVTPANWAQGQNLPLSRGDTIGINSWSQRDRERELRPTEGVMRIACVGDSFLEEGAATPVSLLIERRIGREDVEVVNLGVSATGPDEYYARTSRVALPLGARHCIVFVFAGNDFSTEPRTLETYGGIAAVSPRSSFLRFCGLRGVNHVLTNHRRPVIQAWFAYGDLARREQQLHALIQTLDDQRLRTALLSSLDLQPTERLRLADRLSNADMSELFEMLRNPDAGRFRSYYLTAALRSAAVGGEQWEGDSPEIAFYWVQEIVRSCREEGVGVSIVIIPDGFQVDPRMNEIWSPLADMAHLTEPTRTAARGFREMAEARDWNVLDLHEALDGLSGAYLNLDGHWSQTGASATADAVVAHLRTRLSRQPDSTTSGPD